MVTVPRIFILDLKGIKCKKGDRVKGETVYKGIKCKKGDSVKGETVYKGRQCIRDRPGASF